MGKSFNTLADETLAAVYAMSSARPTIALPTRHLGWRPGFSRIVSACEEWRSFAASALLILIATVPTLVLWNRIAWGDADSFHYMRSGVNLITGRGFLDIADKPMTALDRPLYPLAIGLMSRGVPDVELAARLVSLLGGMLAVGSLYWFLSSRYDFRVAFISTLLFALLPLRVWSGQWVFSDSLSLGLVLLAVAAVFRRDRVNISDGLLGGVALGLAYITRAEVLVYVLLIAAWIFVKVLRSPSQKYSAYILFLASLVSIAVAYHVWFRRETGQWNSMRLQYNLACSDAYYKGEAEPWRFDRDSASIVLRTADNNPGHVAARYTFFLREEISRVLYLAGPAYLVIPPLVVSLVILLFGFRRWMNPVFVWQLMLGSILILLPIFFIKDRFLLQVMPLLCFWLAAGNIEFSKWLRTKVNNGPLRSLAVVPSAVLIVLVLLSYSFRLSTQIPLEAQVTLPKETANLANSKGLTPGRVLAVDPAFAFYANLVQVWMPYQESLEEVLRYARKENARYIYVSNRDASAGLTQALLAETQSSRIDWKLIADVSIGSGRACLFELMPNTSQSR